jgi:fatty acid desaturase
MGKGGGKGGERGERTEAEHTWLSVEGERYDVQTFRHPGGKHLLRPWLGRDATAPFAAFHPNPEVPRKYLRGLRAKEAAAAATPSAAATPETDLQAVIDHAKAQGWFKPSAFFYAWNISSVLLLEALAWLVLYSYGTGWVPYAGAVLLLTTAQAQAGWLQHDFGHNSVFSTVRQNKLMHCFIIGHLKGASSAWWNFRHFRHHAQPNIVREDPDVNVPHLFMLGEHVPKIWGQKKRGFHNLYEYQHLYWWLVGPPLLLPIYFHIDVLGYLAKTRNFTDLGWLLSFFVRWHLQFMGVVGGAGNAFWLYMAVRFVESHWFTWVTQMNHIPMDIDFHPGPEKAKGWVRLQLESTLNVLPSSFNDWFTGHLNYQIEHHLMPTMPRHHYPKVRPLIQELCKKHGIVYREKPLLAAMGDIVASMQTSGEMWRDAYHLDDPTTLGEHEGEEKEKKTD